MVRKTKKYKKTKKNIKTKNGNRNKNNKQNKLKWNSRQKKFKKNTEKMIGGSGGIVSSVSYCYMEPLSVVMPIVPPVVPVVHPVVMPIVPPVVPVVHPVVPPVVPTSIPSLFSNLNFEIIYLYTDNQFDMTEIINKSFNDDTTIIVNKEEKQNFDDKYINYFFRMPNNDENNKLYESKTGLEDPDKDNFNGKNFTGIKTTLNKIYFIDKKKIIINVYNINNFTINTINQLNEFIKKLKKIITESITPLKYTVIIPEGVINENILIKQPKKILGIVQTRYLNIKNNNIKINKNFEITCNNYIKQSNESNRYVEKDLGLRNLGQTCYANSLIQFIKNIKNIILFIANYLKNNKIFNLVNKTSTMNNLEKTYNDLKSDFDKIPKIAAINKININEKQWDLDNLKLYIKLNYLKTIISDKNKSDGPTNNICYDAKNIRSLLNFLNYPTHKPQDTGDFLSLFNYLNFINEIKLFTIKFTYSYKLEFIYYNIDITNINPTLILNIKNDNGNKYDRMQDILNLNYLGEEYDDNITIKYDQKTKEPSHFARCYTNSYYFVDNTNIYIIIQLKLFEIGVDVNLKKQECNIKYLCDNICIKELPDENINKIKSEYKKVKAVRSEIKIEEDLNIDKFKIINYELVSVIFHHGLSLNGGHYVNYSKQIDNKDIKWFKYDDSFEVKEINNVSDEQQENVTPYFFIYKRIEDIPSIVTGDIDNEFIKNIKEKGTKLNNKNTYDKLLISNNTFSIKNINVKVLDIYSIKHGGSEFYFINTTKYIFIFDTIDNLIDNSGLPTIKTGNQYPGCISMTYNKFLNTIEINFLLKKVDCKFGDYNKHTYALEKIFGKIFGFLKLLKFKGQIFLDDQSKYTKDGKLFYHAVLNSILTDINDFEDISIYKTYKFKIQENNKKILKEKFDYIKELIKTKITNTIVKKKNQDIITESLNTDFYTIHKTELENIKINDELKDMYLNFPDDIDENINTN